MEISFMIITTHGVGREAGGLAAGSKQKSRYRHGPNADLFHGFPPAEFTAAESLNITAVDVGAVAFTNGAAPVE